MTRMAINRGSIPMLVQIKAERKGKPLVETGKSRIRLALLSGERLANREVAARFGVSFTALNDAIKDLERVGYEWDREEHAETGAIYWLTNPRLVPKEDSGPTRKRPPQRRRTPRKRKEKTVSHRTELRTQLLSGKPLDVAAFCSRTGASPKTVAGYITRLRSTGMTIVRENGRYVLEGQFNSEDGEAPSEETKRHGAQPPALGASLRCTQHTLVGKKIVARIEDGDGNFWMLPC